MKVYKHTQIETGKLKPYKQNARKHTQEQIDQISRAISEFGFTAPLLVDEKNNVLAGHGRLVAAIGLGLGKVPCVVVAGLTLAQRKALIISDNKLALNAYWDNEMLYKELASLDSIELTGFSGLEMQALFTDDAFPLDEDPNEKKPRRKTDDDSSSFEVILRHESKLRLVTVLNQVKESQGIETTEDAIMWMAESCAAELGAK